MSAPGRILSLSHSHAFGAFRVGSHHYARELALLGSDVVHVSTPISRPHVALGRISASEEAAVPRGPHRDADGVTHLVPRTVLPAPYGRFSIARELSQHRIATSFDAVLIDQPLLWERSVRSLSTTLVYRPTDLYPAGVKQRLQQRIVAAADGVIATSSEVLRGLGAIHQPSLVLTNGVDAARFNLPPSDSDPRPPVCVYVGALDARFDWEQVASWARARPDIRFVLAGPMPASPPEVPSNVDLVGAVPYSELPALLHGARVGLLPLSDDPLNAGRSPMKLYEYLAAGLAVVARETPVIAGDASAGVLTYTGAGDAVDVLNRGVEHPSPNTAGEARALSESWSTKTARMTAFVQHLAQR
jgi:teichuronic acid biosynthesis glycosyltransferase TuaH